MRAVNQITYDLIKSEFSECLKGFEKCKGEKLNVIRSNSYWMDRGCGFVSEYPTNETMLIKQFRIR